MLSGRLGLETARISHADRHGLLWLEYGNLYVQDGTLHFLAATSVQMQAGDYTIPFQNVSLVLLGPGTSVTQDAIRLLARHGTALIAVGSEGVRFYSAMPWGPNDSEWARKQIRLWNVPKARLHVARKMYAVRLGEVFPQDNICVLRGMEGARMKETYIQLAKKYRISWNGRKYDRSNPDAADLPNQAINHAATAVEAAALIATAAVGAIPQLGFIHEDAAIAFPLDIADIYRHTFTIPIAFEAVRQVAEQPSLTLDKSVRQLAGKAFRQQQLISQMIDTIKFLFADGGLPDGGNSNL